MHAIEGADAVDAVSGALMLALGLAVAAAPGGGRMNRAFALYAVSFGLLWIVENLLGPGGDHFTATSALSILLLFALAAAGLVSIVLRFPAPVAEARGIHVVAALAATATIFVGSAYFVFWPNGWALGSLPFDVIANALGYLVFHAVAWGALILLALRYSEIPQGSTRDAARLRLMSMALVVYPSYFASRMMIGSVGYPGWPDGMAVSQFIYVLLKVGAVAVLWLGNSMRSRRPGAERNVAWLVLATALGGLIGQPGFGIVRTLGVVVLAYAIVRHQLLGIDVKLRWGISRGTIAGIFIAVFFVASEAAQEFFGGTTGSEYLGIAAAGALVFALAPLQRAAERLAERAVPLAPEAIATGALTGAPGRERSFRQAVFLATRDADLSREEHGHLHELARDLGIDGARAHAIIVEMERAASAEGVGS